MSAVRNAVRTAARTTEAPARSARASTTAKPAKPTKPTKPTKAARPVKAAGRKVTPAVLLRYRDTDTAFGVTRETAAKLVQHLGLSETQVIHVALAHFAAQTLPRYEMDDGPLTDEQHEQIRKQVPQTGFVGSKRRLF